MSRIFSSDAYGIIRLARRARVYGLLYRLAHTLRRNDEADRAEYARLRETLSSIAAGLEEATERAKRRVLVVGWSSFSSAAMQMPIIAAFIRAGYRPVVVLPSRSNRVAIDLYKIFGVTDFAFWTELPADGRLIHRSDLADVKTTADALAFESDGIRVGRYALSTMMRNLRRGRFDFADPADRELLRNWLQRSQDAVAFGRALLDRWRPDALLLNDQGYIPLGPLFERAVQAGIPAYTWNAAHRDNAIILKRYDTTNVDKHPASLSNKSWQATLQQPWSACDWKRLRDEIVGCYRSGQWYGEVGTQFDKSFPAREELLARLGLDPARRTVLVFPHIFWDGTFFWGHDLFPDYEAFFTETMKVAYRTTSVNWIVKVHPANLVKNRRDGFVGPLGELQVLHSLGAIPANIHLLDASTDISTLSLYKVGDVCVTVRGTVGLEAACFGLATITAGTGRYDRLGFTVDPSSAEEFINTVADPNEIEKPSAEMIERARRYAYSILLARPTPYTCINFGYARDSVASLCIDIRESGPLLDSPEVRSIGDYINSGREDFLNEAS